MKVNLFTTFYVDKNNERQEELLLCLYKNGIMPFNSITLLVESDSDADAADDFIDNFVTSDTEKHKIIVLKRRPTFNDFLTAMQLPEYLDSINILCNSDIFFQEPNSYDSFAVLRDFFFKRMLKSDTIQPVCFALSRWDVTPDGSAVHFDRWDSADCWIFYGVPLFKMDIEFTLGTAGCDNRFAHELQKAGFKVLNPSKTVRTFHWHNTGVRNYIDNNGAVKETVPPPYLLITPHTIEEENPVTQIVP